MSASLSPQVLAQLSQRIEAWMGVYFPLERWPDLERKLHEAAADFGCVDVEECARLLTTAPITKHQLDVLATTLTVGETYFFREPSSLEIVERDLLPKLLQERRAVDQRLRVWSAACCTGEEPYSIAIMLHRLLPDLPSWKLTLLATDINPRFLQKATEGAYGQWSFRTVSPTLQEQYFCRTPSGRYAIQPVLKQMVKFARLNLAEDQYPSPLNDTTGMDIIFCRNVLIYFAAERTKRVIENFYRALAVGGWFIVSAVETALVMDSPFTPVQFPGVTLFRKDPERLSLSVPAASFLGEPTLEPSAPPSPALSVAETLEKFFNVVSAASFEHDIHQAETAPSELPQTLTLQTYEEAQYLYTGGRYAEAIEKLSAICWDGPAETFPFPAAREQGMTLLTRAYANQGQLAEAQLWCDRALAVNTLDPVLHYLRATIALEYGQETEALSSLTRAVSLDQRFVLAHFVLGVLARQRHNQQEAREHFSAALTLLRQHHPDDVLPHSEGMSAGRLAHILVEMNKEQ